MGFDLTIHLNLGIDPITGMAFVWDTITRKPFLPDEYTIPEKFRKYLIQRGSHFHSYIKPYENVRCIEVEDLLDNYPDWLEVENGTGWTEEEHNGFKEALEWMNSGKNNGIFSIRWSY